MNFFLYHVENYNYGHEHAETYEWQDLSDLLKKDKRAQHDYCHAELGICGEIYGFPSFFYDGNHQAEALVGQMERSFDVNLAFLGGNIPFTIQKYCEDVDQHYHRDLPNRDRINLMLAWKAASLSQTPMTAFEARRRGFLPPNARDLPDPNIGDINKWGEAFLPPTQIPQHISTTYFRNAMAVRRRMNEVFMDLAGTLYIGEDVLNEFLMSLHLREVSKIMLDPHCNVNLRFDRPLVEAAIERQKSALRAEIIRLVREKFSPQDRRDGWFLSLYEHERSENEAVIAWSKSLEDKNLRYLNTIYQVIMIVRPSRSALKVPNSEWSQNIREKWKQSFSEFAGALEACLPAILALNTEIIDELHPKPLMHHPDSHEHRFYI